MATTKTKRRLAGVPAAVNTRSFREAFDNYVDGIARVHGADAAESYLAFREGEAIVMDRCGADYPDSQQQQQDFLSLRLEKLDPA